MCKVFLANIINDNLVIHTKEIVSEIEIKLFSLDRDIFIIDNMKLFNNNYFSVKQQLQKGRYKLTINIENKIINRVLTV